MEGGILMESRKRVIDALNHKEGKMPVDIGATPVTGIHVKPLEKLREYYGLQNKPIKVIEPYQMLGEVEDDLREAIGIDTEPFWGPSTLFGFKNERWKDWRTPWGQDVMMPGDFVYSQESGKTYVYACGDDKYKPCAVMPEGGYFFDAIIRQDHFDEDDLKLEDNTEEFAPIDEVTLKFYKDQKEKMSGIYGAVGNFGGTGIGDIALVPGIMLRDPKGIRDITEWYVSTALRPDFLHKIFEYETEVALKNLEKIWAVVGDTVQVAYVCGTDFGTQKGPFCSPDTFKSLYMPYYKIINGWIHEHTTWKTFKHSCGSIIPLIPMLIESGFDVLNPVQWSAENMDRKELKESFGKDIVFWGGGINTQKTLPFGTPEDIRKEVLETCEIFSKDGGFIFNTIHNITADVPVKNIAALVDAVHEFNGER